MQLLWQRRKQKHGQMHML